MGLLDGKKGIIFGIANERSYAWFVAKSLMDHGAQCAFTFMPIGKMERRVINAIKLLGLDDPWLAECDANSDQSLDELFAKLKADWGNIDFVVHSIAFADRNYLKPDKFHQTPRAVFTQAMDTSAYSLLAMAQRALPMMPAGGSIINLSYYGGEKVIPGYNVMGIAKACLEHTTRYLAYELGDNGRNIRVNCISAGPFKTLAGAGVGGMDDIITHHEGKAALKRVNSGQEVGDTAAYLLSDLSSGVTGETIHVDAGFSIVGL